MTDVPRVPASFPTDVGADGRLRVRVRHFPRWPVAGDEVIAVDRHAAREQLARVAVVDSRTGFAYLDLAEPAAVQLLV